jgi:hypothetical protein
MRLVVPLPPNAANSRRNWRVALRDKKRYWESLDLLKAARAFPAPQKPRRATIAATLYLWGPMDDDNALARVKPLLDWLVANEYLPGDSRKHLTWAGIPEQHIDRKNQRLEIEIKEAA